MVWKKKRGKSSREWKLGGNERKWGRLASLNWEDAHTHTHKSVQTCVRARVHANTWPHLSSKAGQQRSTWSRWNCSSESARVSVGANCACAERTCGQRESPKGFQKNCLLVSGVMFWRLKKGSLCVPTEPKRTALSETAPCTLMSTPANGRAPLAPPSASALPMASPTNPTGCPTQAHCLRSTTG